MDLPQRIRNDYERAECQLVNFQVIGQSETGNIKTKEQDEQEASFMYSLLLKEILLKIDDGNEHELVEFCRPQYTNNNAILSAMDIFEQTYSAYSPVTWYTRDGFLYKMLNKALREQHVETIYAFRFFIRQLHIKLMSMSNTREVPILYRGILMPNEQFELIKSKIGGLLSFMGFLSTTTNVDVARIFAGDMSIDSTETNVILIMKVNDPVPADVVLADITGESHFGSGESEWLFSLNTIFRIDSVQKDDINGVQLVHLTLTNSQDAQLMKLTEHFRATINDIKPLIELGRLTYEMGNVPAALTFYTKALESETEWQGRSLILNNLGAFYDDLDDLDNALMYYQQSLEIDKEHRPASHPSFGPTYSNIGIIQWRKNQFEDALSSFQLAINNLLAEDVPNQEILANTYNNIGTVLFSLERYEESLSAKLKAHSIKVKVLPELHSSIAISCQNIAKSLYDLNRIEEAIEYIQKAVDIDVRSLTSGHPQIAEHKKLLEKYTSKLNVGIL